MNLSDERTLAHARAIRARGLAMPPEGLPSGVILDSWARCLELGLAPSAALSVPVVEAAELAQRRERGEFVRRLAQAELETLSRQIAGSNYLLAFADRDGVVLDLYADNRFSMSGSDAGILAGSVWREEVAGTNGMGTALALERTVAVTGMEHYFLRLAGISCTATPVRDAHGHVVGVLDASSYYESRQRHTQALVQMAATHIENGLLAHQMRGHLVLAVHPRAEFLGTLSAGLLAFDGDGLLVAVNSSGRHLLSGLELVPGTRFEELFRESLELVLARLHGKAEVRLRDALGSVLVASMVGWPGRSTAAMAPQPTPAPAARASRAPALSTGADAPPFLADDASVAETCRLAQAAMRMRVPILLHGETGTGKEMLARHAHRSSGRQGQFVAVNCAALPGELFEAELFGYVSGAFTGARREGNAGLIVAADRGTLLLDEVSELPLPLQASLLRFLDDHHVRPVGGHSGRTVDVQVLAASHADLEAAVAARTFRQDLLYRLNTVRLSLPPLRQRADLAQAVRWVLSDIDATMAIDDQAIEQLARHSWPGNFRELRSVLTRALLQHAPALPRILSAAEVQAVLPALAAPAAAVSRLQRSAAELVLEAYARCGHSVSLAARTLGISRTTVYRHLRGSGFQSTKGRPT